MFRHFARTYMAARECLMPSNHPGRRREAQEEVLADLNTCVEQLNDRTLEMETRILRCTEKATIHARLAHTATNAVVRAREKQKAKLFLSDRRRIQANHDKTLRTAHMLQTHIDGLVSSHVDTMIVQTMRSYNATAARLAMPALTSQVEQLSDELSDRNMELSALQDAMTNVTNACAPAGDLTAGSSGLGDDAWDDDADLMAELEGLLLIEPDTQAEAVASVPCTMDPNSLKPSATRASADEKKDVSKAEARVYENEDEELGPVAV